MVVIGNKQENYSNATLTCLDVSTFFLHCCIAYIMEHINLSNVKDMVFTKSQRVTPWFVICKVGGPLNHIALIIIQTSIIAR